MVSLWLEPHIAPKHWFEDAARRRLCVGLMVILTSSPYASARGARAERGAALQSET